MIPNNFFHDICPEPSDMNHVLTHLDITSSLAESLNLSIVNYDCKDAFQNKLQKLFFKHLTDYYEEGSITLFEVLKHQICQTLIITNNDIFVGGAIYVISPTEGSFVFFLHIDQKFKNQGIGTTLLQIIQKRTITKLKTNNMLIWIEIRPYQQQQHITDVSGYYKKLGFHLTNPTNHEIQYIVPPTVLNIINETDSYSHIMRCTKPIQKQEEIRRAMNHFTYGKCDMCQASGCITVCTFNVQDSLNTLTDEKQLHSICGTSLCMTCQTGFGMTINNRCAIHQFAAYSTKKSK